MNAPPDALPDTIDDVVRRLEEMIDHCKDEEDPCGYFAALYHRITVAVRDAVARGEFQDGERMKRLDVAFARRYFTAYDDMRANHPCTAPWRVAFSATRRWPPLVLQHLLCGVNAHVDLDLGIAAAEICRGEDLQSLKDDFFTLNALLGQEVDVVRRELEAVSPVLGWFDVFRRIQDKMVAVAVDLGRDHAWHLAERLHAADDETARALVEKDSSRTADLARLIVWPGVILGFLLILVRLTERGSVRRKIDDLMRKATA